MPVTLQIFDLPCATALALVEPGERALLVRTDPASNLEPVLGTPLGSAPRPIPGALGREAPIADPEAAAPEAERRRAGIEPYAGALHHNLPPSTPPTRCGGPATGPKPGT